MRLLGNLIWLVLAGLWLAVAYVVAGLLTCLTIIGIPFGLASFKMAVLALVPFGKTVVPERDLVPGATLAVGPVGRHG